MSLFLKPLTESADLAGSFPIPEGVGSYSVGRLMDNDLTIRHESVSGLHARIEATGINGVDLIDCGSSNGTFVNGEKIGRCELKAGDLVRFASAKFRVEVMPSEEEVPVGDREKEIAARESEIDLLTTQLARESAAAEERIAKLTRELRTVREESMEKEKRLATLEFEVSRRDTSLQQWEEKYRHAEEEWARWQSDCARLETALEEVGSERDEAQAAVVSLQDRFATVRAEISGLAAEWREDWSYWTGFEESSGGEDSVEAGAVAGDVPGLAQLRSLREAVRRQLDRIEPIWKEYGDRVAEELQKRSETLQSEQRALEEEKLRREEELARTTTELAGLREEVDREVRRAQGLSRRNVEVAIPERYESMVIARDREQELFLALIERIEFFERLIEGYRRSKKMKEAIYELEDFRKRLVGMLEENGVEAFALEPGFFLTLKQRREVKVFGRKGWGTREFIEQPFQPGKVTKVIRCGYRAGSGDAAVILRKVEVLIQEAEG